MDSSQEENKFVLNLSKFKLNKDHISLLSKGLNFCPTPGEPDPGQDRLDLDNLHKRLRLLYHFRPDPDDTLEAPSEHDKNLFSRVAFYNQKFKCPSTFNPVGAPNLEAMILSNENALNNRPTYKPPRRNNLSPGERRALKELQLNEDIVIKKADKGAVLVIQDRSDYISEGLRQLSDSNFYKKLDHNPTEKHRVEVQSLITKMYTNGEIEDSVYRYLLDTECKTPNLYLLPKIHKGFPLKSRPIMSANGSPTEKISKFVDHFLFEPSTHNESYVKDTTHFLKIIRDTGNVPHNSILVTLDVTSLYTNIDINDGLSASKEALNNFRPQRDIHPSNDYLIELLELVLTRNNFQFNNEQYLQIKGCAMGSRVSPSLANVTMGKFESNHVYTYHLQPHLFVRYLDDIFMIWPHGIDELHKFVEHLNSCTESIRFTLDFSREKINFLDTTVILRDATLYTDLYCKPTDSHSYLLYNSAHPLNCKNSIPYSQFLRIRRICSTLDNFDKHCLDFAQYFYNRGYPPSLVEEAYLKARRTNRDTLLDKESTTNSDNDDNVILVTTYHPEVSYIPNIVNNNWDLLGKSHNTQFIHEKHVLKAFRRPPNLRDMLVRASTSSRKSQKTQIQAKNLKFPQRDNNNASLKQPTLRDFFNKLQNPDRPLTHSFSEGELSTHNILTTRETRTPSLTDVRIPTNMIKNKCITKKCRYCPNLDRIGTITCTVTGTKYNCKKNFTCKSSNLIYAITCQTCKMQYVGQTKRTLLERFQGHYGNINKAFKTTSFPQNGNNWQIQSDTLGKHFSNGTHRGTQDLNIQVLEFIPLPRDSERALQLRLKMEKHWIHKLRCSAPQGLNIME